MRNLGATELSRDSFEHLDEEALQKMQRTSPWLNDALLTEEDREEIARAFREKPSKPVRFCASGDEQPPQSRVDGALLFQQVEAVCKSVGARATPNIHKHVVVMHQIVTRTDKIRLAQWHKRDELVRPLFDSVHCQIYARRQRYASLCDGEMDSTALLQQRLVDSRFVARSLYVRDAVQMLEAEMGVRLVRLLIRGDTLLMLFEWLDVQPFAIVLAFSVELRCEETRRLAAAHILSLGADDLMKFNEVVEAETGAAKTNTNASSTTVSPQQQQKELPLELCAETHPMDCVKRALQNAFIMYITLAYVKRES